MSQDLYRQIRVQFPYGLNRLDSNVILHQSRNIVNEENEKHFKKSDELESWSAEDDRDAEYLELAKDPENADIRSSAEEMAEPEYWSGIFDGLRNAEAKAYTKYGFIQCMKEYGVSEEELREAEKALFAHLT